MREGWTLSQQIDPVFSRLRQIQFLESLELSTQAHGENGFVTATKLGTTTDKIFVAATKKNCYSNQTFC